MQLDIAKSGIYQIRNLANGKVYIGSTTMSFRNRWKAWRADLKKGEATPHLQAAWIKYGELSFEFSILEVVEDIEHTLEREQYWIDLTGCTDQAQGYNICPIAGSRKGKPMHPNTREALRKANTGRKKSIEELQALSQRMKEQIQAPEFKKAHAAAQKARFKRDGSPRKGATHTDEAKAKMSEAHKNQVPWHRGLAICKRGHDLNDPTNVSITNKGSRQCKACRRMRRNP